MRITRKLLTWALALVIVLTAMTAVGLAEEAKIAELSKEWGVYSQTVPETHDVWWVSYSRETSPAIETMVTPDDGTQYWHFDENGNPTAWEKIKVLFIGNSFTYQMGTSESFTGGVGRLFDEMAEELGYYVETTIVTVGGGVLNDRLAEGDNAGAQIDYLLSHEQYDHIVLSDLSTGPLDEPERFFTSVEGFKNKIEAVQDHAKIHLYATWSSPANAGKYGGMCGMERTLRELFTEAGEKFGLDVTYVGKAFTYMYLTENMDIWARDNRHQGFAGAYLSACTHAQAILGIDPRQTTVEYKEEFGELQKGAIYDEAGYKLIREIAYDVFHGNTLDDEALNALADLADEAESYTVVTPDNYEAAQATLAKMEKDNYAKTLLSNKIAAYEAGRELGEYSENIPVSYDVYWNMMAKQDDILTLITDDDAKYWHYDANGNPVAWEKTKVLFIGNSFTYQNGNPGNLSGGVPRIFNDIAEDLGYYVETYMIAGPNWYLYKHADAADECGKQVDELLHHFNDFDYVVIQEQSVTPAVDYDTFLDGVKSLQGKINDTQDHAKIYLYATWGSPLGLTNIINDNGFTDFHDVEEMELGIRNAYYAAGEACQLPVTPVGKAYIRAFHEGIDPWAVFDHRHPGHTGAYLSACVHVANMLGGDPRRTTFECDETIEPTPVRLDADTYKALRQIAYEIVKEGVEVDDDAHLTTRVMMHLLDGENIVSTTGVCATIGDTEASVKVDVPEGYSLPDPLAAMLKRLDGSETAEGFAITYTEAEGRNPATLNFTLAEDEITEEITFEVALTK